VSIISGLPRSGTCAWHSRRRAV